MLSPELEEKLKGIEQRYLDLQYKLSIPEVLSDRESLTRLGKELKEIEDIYLAYREYKKLTSDMEQARELLRNDELRELAREEIERLNTEIERAERKLRVLLLPRDPRDSKNVILEIRAGVGGEEAALFVSDLLNMYQKYAEERGWRFSILSANKTGLGGYKEVIALIEGDGAYSRLKFESGVHRVQRVPITEAGGRIHTSTATVAVLPETDETEIQIDPKELRIETFRASGAGGQYVNTTESAVRVTHLPTGISVSCQDERSQFQNRQKALKILYARLRDYFERQKEEELAKERKQQVGTGERSEKIRTYNFSQNRVTDHRINLTIYRLGDVLQGKLDELLQALMEHHIEEKLRALA